MSVDKNFLNKYHLYNECLNQAAIRNCRVEHSDKPFTGLDPNFCKMVIMKSQITQFPCPEAKNIKLEQLCGMIPDPDETNKYYYVRNADLLYTGNVKYELWQHHNSPYPYCFILEVPEKDYNNYLNFMFSYCDKDCMDEYIRQKFKDNDKDGK